MDVTSTLVAIAGAFLLAGYVKGVIGLGLPTVSIGLLGLLMTPAQAAANLVVPSVVTNIWQAAVGGGLLALARRLWPLLAGICIGTAVGVMTMAAQPCGWDWPLAIYAALGLVKVEFSVPRHAETWLGLLMDAATGAIRLRPASSSCPEHLTSNRWNSTVTSWCRRSACHSRCQRSPLRRHSPIPGTCKHSSPGLQLSRSSRRLSGWAWDNSRAAKSRLRPSGCVSLSD